MKYYFTFGSEGQLFVGGWVTVTAKSFFDARRLFIEHYGKNALDNNGFLRFSFQYDEDEFEKTGMATKGNIGAFCHEEIGKEESE